MKKYIHENEYESRLFCTLDNQRELAHFRGACIAGDLPKTGACVIFRGYDIPARLKGSRGPEHFNSGWSQPIAPSRIRTILRV